MGNIFAWGAKLAGTTTFAAHTGHFSLKRTYSLHCSDFMLMFSPSAFYALSGSFGEIYLGYDTRSEGNEQKKIAVKVESMDTKYPQLIDEFNVYKNISVSPGLPKVFWCGHAGKCNVMVRDYFKRDVGTSFGNYSFSNVSSLWFACFAPQVMELLGGSLETLYNKCGRRFSLK